MPKIYEYIGYILFFYANEHLPIHCHIKHQHREVKAEIFYENGKPFVKFIRIKGTMLLQTDEIKVIEGFIMKKHKEIVNKWMEFFVKGVKPKVEKINKKI